MGFQADDIGYRIGYVLERLRTAPRDLPGVETLLGFAGASGRREGAVDRAKHAARALLPGSGRSAAQRIVRRVAGSGGIAGTELVLAAFSGAGAASLAELLAPWIHGEDEAARFQEGLTPLLEGIGRALVYAGVVEPRVPGPAFVAGFVFGTVEYLTSGWGGLPRLLRSASPHRRLPLGSRLLEPDRSRRIRWTDMIVYGVALSLLYELLRAKSGIVDSE